MRSARVDKNQTEIVEALRAIGASVQSLATVGKGVPDLLVGYRGQNWLLEVKGKNGVLTAPQITWHAEWRGRVYVVRDAGDAIVLISGAHKKQKVSENDQNVG